MGPLQSFAIRLASCLVLAVPVACGRGSRAEGTGSVDPTAAARAAAARAEAARAEASGLPSQQDTAAALARAQALQAFMLAEGDAADRARARFELAEAYANAVAQLDLVRFAAGLNHLSDVRSPSGRRFFPTPDARRELTEVVEEVFATSDAP